MTYNVKIKIYQDLLGPIERVYDLYIYIYIYIYIVNLKVIKINENKRKLRVTYL